MTTAGAVGQNPAGSRERGRPIRIGAISGFYGDRLLAARDMVDGGDVDVLIGDYLAELTMYLLDKARRKDPEAGYARTFLTQAEQVLGTCLERGIRIVSNAGGLNPPGLARELRRLAERLGLDARVASVHGDDLIGRLGTLRADGHEFRNLDTGEPLSRIPRDPVTVNAYLGAWPIAQALQDGADIVVTGRVTDASLVVGPAAWWHDWTEHDYDRLAGAVVAGHVIECGPQATGGNFAFFDELPDTRYPGYPIAEIAQDGSSVITKNPDTGGLVTVGTVTAQLLYEIQSPAYAGPDVTTWFDTIRLDQEGRDRVRISGTKGSPPDGRVKVAVNYVGGYRNTMTVVLTGLDIDRKARVVEEQLLELLGGRDSFADLDLRLLRLDKPEATTQAEASAQLVVTAKDPDPQKVGRRFSGAFMELMLASVPGFYVTTPPTSESEYGVYWPALLPASEVTPVLTLPDGTERAIPLPAGDPAAPPPRRPDPSPTPLPAGSSVRAPLGAVAGARSGDKGGNANIGVWVRDDAEFAWLQAYLTEDVLHSLLPEADGLRIRRHELPWLRALNFVITGILGEGVASSTRLDPQAKALGEFLRSREVDIPTALLGNRGQ